MTKIYSNRIKALAVGAAVTCVLGGGVGAVLLPSFANAAASQGADDGVRYLKGADDAVQAKSGVEDAPGHVKHTDADDGASHT